MSVSNSSRIHRVLWTSMLWLCSLQLSAAVVARAQSSSDADRATARELGRQGLTALDQGDFATAEDRLSRAIALHDVPTLRLARAQARRSLGRFVSAGEDYRSVMRLPQAPGEPAVFGDARRDARAELGTLEPQIPRLTLVLKGGVASVRVGGADWPQATIGVARPIDPGEYLVEVFPSAAPPFTQRVRVDAGTQPTLVLEVGAPGATSPAPPAAQLSGLGAVQPVAPQEAQPPTSPRSAAVEASLAPAGKPTASTDRPDRTAAYIVAGTAAAMAVAAMATGALYLFKLRPDYEDANEIDSAELQRISVQRVEQTKRLRDKAETMGLVSLGFTVATVVVGGVGAYLYFSPSESQERTTAGIQSRPGGRTELGIRGRF